MTTIIREFRPSRKIAIGVIDGVVILRTDTYDHCMAHFNELFAEAKKDYPELDVNTTYIQHYGGERYKGTWGIEFSAMDAPSNYTIVNEVEKTL